ncbi:tetratricopeptide repeat protein [Pseudomonas matsuisoli]|uniref:Tetratricopeptide repeat protein 38 n=1 Tax=Pseudomonas matsuisoli TaxID=1515666 RepID=A0A917PQ08_9PSED|nr:tetratricopeptide repeat protein [Pseudomonas matsuisoli]GGJ86798.1 tetratricopeptide repeat protein 38 family protein [Pseudomonas matsuisoli]
MAFTDQRDLAISTISTNAAELYNTGIDLLLSLWPGADQTLDLAINADPNFALAHAAKARLYAIGARPSEAKVSIAHAKDLVMRYGDARERSHVETLWFAINGLSDKALDHALAHVNKWPRDVLIFGLPLGAFGLFAFSGMSDHDHARVELCERYSRHFSEDDWWFLTYRGWSHTENGSLSIGREKTQRALELRKENANAAHALAHTFYECGASSEAEELIASWLPSYDRSGILHGHIAWHGALTALEQGDALSALRYYDRYVSPAVSNGTPVNIISDSASFLWRFQAYGNEVMPALWQEAADYASAYFQQPGFPFADFHMSLIASHTGAGDSVETRVAGLSEMVQRDALPAGAVVPALCLAAQAFSSGDYHTCMDVLEPHIGEVVRIGGSGAQREIVEDMLLISYLRTDEIDKSKLLLNARLHRRPSTRDTRWLSDLQV